jgi:hypothetical protein
LVSNLGVLEVVAPERADLVLTADVPDGEADVLVLDRLNIETCRKLARSRPSAASRGFGAHNYSHVATRN